MPPERGYVVETSPPAAVGGIGAHVAAFVQPELDGTTRRDVVRVQLLPRPGAGDVVEGLPQSLMRREGNDKAAVFERRRGSAMRGVRGRRGGRGDWHAARIAELRDDQRDETRRGQLITALRVLGVGLDGT